MNISKEAFHGSDIEVIAEQHNMNPASIVPYASNVNPLGISPMAKQAILDNIDVISRYPDRNYEALRQSISRYCGASPSQLILGNGTSDLLQTTLETLKPKKTVVIGPTYSEYRRVASLVGSKVANYNLKEKDDFDIDVERFLSKLDPSIDLVIICNPNNPTSKLISKEKMEEIVSHCIKLRIFVLVDETYIEFVNDVNAVSSTLLTRKFENLIVLRGVSKFFAAPGLRLGYAITNNAVLLSATSDSKVPWNINSYAAIAGVMFEDESYIQATRNLIQTERNLIYSALSSRKTIKVFQPDANFILIKLLNESLTSGEVFEHCIQKGFMIRDCSNYEGLTDRFIRFCFLKPEQNDQLVNTLLEIV